MTTIFKEFPVEGSHEALKKLQDQKWEVMKGCLDGGPVSHTLLGEVSKSSQRR